MASPAPKGGGKIQDVAVMGAMIVSLVLGIILFRGVPNFVSANIGARNHWPDWQTNLVTEIIHIFLFLGYIVLIGQHPDIKRVFQYHGAEHKAINVLEAHEELNMANCVKQTRLHPRCGTSFAIIVLIVSLIILTFIPRPHGMHWAAQAIVRFLYEIPILFVIAGISYELLRFAGRNRDTMFVKILFAPGLASQYLTTREPDASQIEVSLAALQHCIKAEETGEYDSEPVVVKANEDGTYYRPSQAQV